MIQHIVLIKWKPDTTEQDIVAAFEAARALLDEIGFVQKLTLGRNRGESDHGFTHAMIVNLADDAALRDYLDHPTRMRYLRERLQPLERAAHRDRRPGRHGPPARPDRQRLVVGRVGRDGAAAG